MSFNDLRDFLSRLEEMGELHRVHVPVDPIMEIAAITSDICKLPGGGPAIIFEHVRGSNFPVAVNLFGSESRVAEALLVRNRSDLTPRLRRILEGMPGKSAVDKLKALVENELWRSFAPVMQKEPPCQAIRDEPLDLGIYPILKSWPLDGVPDHSGRFITLPVVVTSDPNSGALNCGMYRVAILGPDRIAIHLSPTSGAAAHAAAWRLAGKPMPVAIAVGGDPVVTFASTLPLPKQMDEFTFAGLLRGEPTTVAQCLTSDLLVPAGAELVIEGLMYPECTVGDGAFGNHTGYYEPSTPAPLIRVTAISRRIDMIYPATVVGPPPMEDCRLAKAAERLILALLQVDFPEVVDIDQPLAGIFQGATVVSVEKSKAGQGLELLASLWKTPWLCRSRFLVVVDSDQPPADGANIYWRVLNNVDWQRDMLIEGEKLAIDATRKFPEELSGRAREPVLIDKETQGMINSRRQEYGFDESE